MLIKKFEEQVARFPQKVAVKTRDKVFTYQQLDRYANCIAHAILDRVQLGSRQPVVSLLFEHGVHMIAALLGALKAGCIYVPLDNSFPEGRLQYMLGHSDTCLILTNTANHPLAEKLVCQASPSSDRSIDLLDIEPLEIKTPSVSSAFGQRSPTASVASSKIAYILYTSGSTGKPKGVYQTHENVFYYIRNWTRRFSITEADNMTLLTAFSHDGAAQDIFAALLNGAALFPYSIKNARHRHELADFLLEEQITIWHSVPTVFRYFVDTLTRNEDFSQLRFILLGGESLRSRDVMLLKNHFPHSIMANVYGQTESSVTSIALITPEETFKTVVIGEPLDRTQIFLVNDDGDVVEDFGTGEIVVACNHLAPGYWKDPEATRKSFTKEPDVGRLYWTGDLGGLMEDGRIEILGRKDRQVKIRGFRIELGEIESTLLQHSSVREAIVTAREDKNKDNYLCAYVKGIFEKVPAGTILREYLLHTLPDYMIPSYFIQVEKMPLTPTGKVDRKALPAPESMESRVPYAAPRNEIEKELTALWSGVLNVHQSSIGIDNNFFELGGHSLKAVTLSLKILQQLNVKLDLVEIFSMPSIRQLTQHIETAARDYYASLEEVEQREYYELSSAQKRMFVLSQQEGIGTAYNIYKIFIIKGKVDKNRIESVFSALIRKHESLRTSFHIVGGHVVQKVQDHVAFEIKFLDLATEDTENTEVMDKIIKNFIHPFDLSQAPLLRVGLFKLEEEKHILVYDMHHIISDGVSIGIMIQDFIRLYQGTQLPSLRIQYKDFALWQNKLFQSDVMQQQEEYWNKKFNDEQGVPLPTMPLDYERPDDMTFAGDTITVTFTGELMEPLNRLAQEESVTLNILLLAIYTLLVSRYSGQEDVVIGSLVSGRPHPDLEEVLGLFVNFLPIRNAVENGLTFKEFLGSVKNSALAAYQNQDYPFEEMVKKADLPDHPAINAVNPLFSTMFLFHSEADRTFAGGIENLEFHDIEFKDATSTLDFKLDVYPVNSPEPELYCRLEYNTNLFKKDTMEQFLNRFRQLVETIIANPQQKLAGFQVFTEVEEQQISQKRETFEPEEKTKIKLAAAATFTAEPIKEYMVYWGNEYHMDIRVDFAPYNQVFQQLLVSLQPSSDGKPTARRAIKSFSGGPGGRFFKKAPLAANIGSSSVNLVLVRFEDWIRDHPGASDKEKCEKLEKNFAELTRIFQNRLSSIPLFTAVFPTAPHLGFSDFLFQYLENIYQRWGEAVKTIDNTYLIDFTRLQTLYQVEEVFNPETDREGHIPFSSEFYAAMGTYIARHIFAYYHQHYKVISLDCDNTLWKGICGEDGPEGVEIEGPWLELQEFMLQKYRQGMLLVLCSKNNEADVWEVFAKNPHMPLKKDHFAAWRINWNPKSRNLEELAEVLNLGIDTFIYVDDNPLECSEVMTYQPEVLTVQLPGDPEEIPMFLHHIWAFDRVKVTEEDEKRSRMYVTERKRKEIRESMPSLEEFIKSLELNVHMMPLKPDQLSRASQLMQRTNQFNLSTIRRSEGDIRQLMQTPGNHCWILDVSDRFGEYGLTGLVIAKEKEEEDCLFIDTLLLSCRVLGRNVENALLTGLAQFCRKRNLSQLKAHYYPTAKNKPLLEFLERTGWQETGQFSDPDYTEFILAVKDIPLSVK